MKTKHLLCIVLAAVSVVASAVAGKSPAADQNELSKGIVGKWQGGKDQTLCFAQDGSYFVEPAGTKGRWRIEGKQVIITYSNGQTSAIKIVYLKENELGLERKGDVERCPRISH